MVTTRIKDVLWYCVICERTIDGKADDPLRVCEGNIVTKIFEDAEEQEILNSGRDSHVPIEMEAT